MKKKINENVYTLHNHVLGLKFLVRICTDLGLKDAQDYANKLKKAEKSQRLREEVLKSPVFLVIAHFVQPFCVLSYK